MKHRLADRILAWSPWQSLRGVKAVSFEEYCLRERLGYAPALPESLAIGSMLEMANWLAMLSSDFTWIAWPTEIGECQIARAPGPGERMLIEIELLERVDNQVRFRGHATSAGEQVIRIEQSHAELLPLDSYHDASDLRVLYSEIAEVP